MVSKVFPAILLFIAVGCTHALHVHHMGDMQPFNSSADYKRITAQSEQFTIMGMVKQTDYVNEVFAQLEQKCPDGEITGIQTRYSTSH